MSPRKRASMLIPDDVLQDAAKVLRVLSHADRMRMVELLMHRDLSVGELADEIDLPPAAVSQHLNHMAAHGIVEGERQQRQMFYRVIHPSAMHLIECLRNHNL